MPLSKSMFKAGPISRAWMDNFVFPCYHANLEPGDRVGYIVPITGDQVSFSRTLREEIRTALGGQDEISISASVTATELKSIYGRVAATARKVSRYLRHCTLHGDIIYREERLFRDSLAAVGLEKPVDLTEDATPQQEEMYEGRQ